MKIQRHEGPEEMIANITPLIDVVFLLLIFFMVTTTFLNPEREIDVDLPTAESAGTVEAPPEELVITIDREGQVFAQGASQDREGLLRILRAAAQRDPETPITIRGDREARHEAIVGVMDACGVAGLSVLSVGTTVDQG